MEHLEQFGALPPLGARAATATEALAEHLVKE